MSSASSAVVSCSAAPLLPLRQRPAIILGVLGAVDVAAVLVAWVTAAWLVEHFSGPLHLRPHGWIAPGAILYPLVYARAGLYPGYGVSGMEQFRRLAAGTTLVSPLVGMVLLVFRGWTTAVVSVVPVAWLLALVAVPLARGAARRVLSRTPWWGKPVLILDVAGTGQLVVRNLLQQPILGLRPVGCLDDNPDHHGQSYTGLPVLGPIAMAPALARRHGIRTGVLTTPGTGAQRLLTLVALDAGTRPRFVAAVDLSGIAGGWIDVRDRYGVLRIQPAPLLFRRWNTWLKRGLDLALGVPLLVAAAPVIGLSALAVKLLSPGPAFYAQVREGLGGRPIRVWKIRTMVPDAERVLQVYLKTHPQARREWEQHMKLRHDPRVVPRIGHFLRRYSLDELPQFWNVLRGDMSLVGPRPLPRYHLRRYSGEFRNLRRRVLPGITGLWQVMARSDADLATQEELDTCYIRNWSMWLDVYLLARTVTAVLGGKGAY